MYRQSSTVAIRALAMLALTAVMLVPAVRNGDTARQPRELSADRSGPAPVIVAQGRCFNGRCF